ncbi:MAG: hypothetical protein OEX07_14910 [Gammaproteobacteria bacterium]|nr:hypothetical protein [Gammaproteobacteria bacterium]
MDIKKETLEKIINDSIADLKTGFHDAEAFAIYEGEGVQVQIEITKNKGDWHDEVLPEYKNSL